MKYYEFNLNLTLHIASSFVFCYAMLLVIYFQLTLLILPHFSAVEIFSLFRKTYIILKAMNIVEKMDSKWLLSQAGNWLRYL